MSEDKIMVDEPKPKSEGGKAEIANWVAAALIVSGLLYAISIDDLQLVTMLASAGIGYLFGKAAKNGSN